MTRVRRWFEPFTWNKRKGDCACWRHRI